jgi:hypothetical protein
VLHVHATTFWYSHTHKHTYTRFLTVLGGPAVVGGGGYHTGGLGGFRRFLEPLRMGGFGRKQHHNHGGPSVIAI